MNNCSEYSQSVISLQKTLNAAYATIKFKCAAVSLKKFSQNYDAKGWVGRKFLAIPSALWSGLAKTTYHIALTILAGVPCAIIGKNKSFKKYLFSAIRDCQESLGHILLIFNDRVGKFHIQESQFHKECYYSYKNKTVSIATSTEQRNDKPSDKPSPTPPNNIPKPTTPNNSQPPPPQANESTTPLVQENITKSEFEGLKHIFLEIALNKHPFSRDIDMITPEQWKSIDLTKLHYFTMRNIFPEDDQKLVKKRFKNITPKQTNHYLAKVDIGKWYPGLFPAFSNSKEHLQNLHISDCDSTRIHWLLHYLFGGKDEAANKTRFSYLPTSEVQKFFYNKDVPTYSYAKLLSEAHFEGLQLSRIDSMAFLFSKDEKKNDANKRKFSKIDKQDLYKCLENKKWALSNSLFFCKYFSDDQLKDLPLSKLDPDVINTLFERTDKDPEKTRQFSLISPEEVCEAIKAKKIREDLKYLLSNEQVDYIKKVNNI